MRWRSLVALVLLVGYGMTTAESVLGDLRDGAVHHESTAEAIEHTENARGEHGHEDVGEHGPEHQHGTSVDHCTHTHSVSLPTQHEFGFVALQSVSSEFSETLRGDTAVRSLFHPPKA